MRRLIKQHHIVRHHQIIRTVKSRIIRLNHMKIVRIFLRKVIEKLLIVFGIHPVVILNHQFTSQGFNNPIKITGFKCHWVFTTALTFFRLTAVA